MTEHESKFTTEVDWPIRVNRPGKKALVILPDQPPPRKASTLSKG